MSDSILFHLTLHAHQPVGNLPEVFRKAYEDSYRPFLEALERHPLLRATLHISGSLLEWIEEEEPGFVDRLRRLVGSGQVEILGGGFYEPILTMIPRRDAIGQVHLFRGYLRDRLGADARGLWLSERVWEPSLPSLLAEAGVEWTMLDDAHFLATGLRSEDLHGWYLAEDQGAKVAVVPISERLRYTIPFRDVHETIDVLARAARRCPGTLLAYGDDLEKFGLWPETYDHVWRNGWLERFFETLERESGWIRTVHLSEALRSLRPRGPVSPPETSYPEMNEWALPPHVRVAYDRAREAIAAAPERRDALPFLRGASWRSFRIRYPEIRRLYGRMLRVSGEVAALPPGEPATACAVRELYRSQCNCPYWHGIFGGHYLPHLREAAYFHLLQAETIARGIRAAPALSVEVADVDLDGEDEVMIRNREVGLWFSPARGGTAFALDLFPWGLAPFATIARRPEAYHADVAHTPEDGAGDDVRSIHDRKRSKDPHLADALRYDRGEHAGFSDLFLETSAGVRDLFEAAVCERADFRRVRYDVSTHVDAGGASVELLGRGPVAGPASPAEVEVAKTVRIHRDAGGVSVAYRVRATGGCPLRARFAVEIPFAMQAGRSPRRTYRSADGEDLGPMETMGEIAREALDILDEDHDLRIRIRAAGASIWAYPVRTVSQSEDGFEGLYQNSVVVPNWPLELAPGESFEASIALEFARARATLIAGRGRGRMRRNPEVRRGSVAGGKEVEDGQDPHRRG
ncbi:MAG: DUF1926 domain-containing protein [Planctomycetes bacterium]|nr:DUF1926 domain-containing protein [Planctomycetota bacterium]